MVLHLPEQNPAALMKKLLKEYYTNNDIAPTFIERHEFGFGDFEKKIAFRHSGFRTKEDFKRYLLDNVPASIHCSSAEYEKPAAKTMEEKGLIGAELVFDLDASDLNLPCQKVHGKSWTCEECLIGVKHETVRLVEEFLVPDFGFLEREIKINFSGNRGYHMHIMNEELFKLDANARRKISGYVSGLDINPEVIFPTIGQKGKRLSGPKPTDYGWGGKFARGMISALNTGETALTNLGIEKSIARKLAKNNTEIVLGISNGNWDKINIPKKDEFWKAVIKNMAIKQSNSIDKNVTNDPQHLIRLPNSVHSDTALIAKRLGSFKELEKFAPLKDAIAFKEGMLKIHVNKSDKIYMNEVEYGPYENKDVELPTYAALYLVLKKVAMLI